MSTQPQHQQAQQPTLSSSPQSSTTLPTKQSTLDYLHTLRIKDALESLINEVIATRPANPYSFMAARLHQWAQQPPHSFTQQTSTPSQSQPQSQQPRVVFVLGGPGAGKGTQCNNIVQQFGWIHLSAGDLLREARNAGNETGQMIDSYIKEGKIVPVEVTVNLLKRAMQQHFQNNKFNFLIDGFPRNADNLQGWEQVMGQWCEVLFVLFFDCPQAVMEERLLIRGETSGRTDDNIESIRKRFVTYQQSTIPIIQHYESMGKCHRIDASPSAEVVYQRVKQVFQAIR